ncbi:hypothetical protein H6G17_26250 [Chroococcidiopsis sp. FACHB-1243]|uniref:nucleotidyltransferase domain-containing protein n=1 Tax=Chroococcidiopsis sp. [FACHB-1243] TaxID=2692781 RepID=UPI001783CB7E|nr:hypothetical protein [Chroococcidiopsis sp. [FACHB-1243]]MBD2308974.1 hypothetical protein [Chroococcidiopsis sp. [FACHB-1243]]
MLAPRLQAYSHPDDPRQSVSAAGVRADRLGIWDCRSVDFHTVQQDSSGQFIQALQDGTPFHYPQNSLAGQGTIDGNVISCITPEAQMLCYTGYKPQAKDIHNVRLLQQYFNLPLPEEYVGVVTDFE